MMGGDSIARGYRLNLPMRCPACDGSGKLPVLDVEAQRVHRDEQCPVCGSCGAVERAERRAS